MKYDAAIVGAGVSGCACAVVLAEAGLSVLLLNSALDVVGLPAYGPDVAFGEAECEQLRSVFSTLPPQFADAWLLDARAARNHPEVVLIDRRAVSLRTKWLLESYPRVSMRQALVTSVLGSGEAGHYQRAEVVRLSTGFGEELTARACVLAVGLALGGRTRLGQLDVPGGRYGEVSADALAEQMARTGVPLEQVSRRVGSRLQLLPAEDFASWRSAKEAEATLAAGLGGPLSGSGDELVAVGLEPLSAHDGTPYRLFEGMADVPSPYDLPSSLPDIALFWMPRDSGVDEVGAQDTAFKRGTVKLPRGSFATGGVFPDGHVGSQWYATPGLGNFAAKGSWTVIQPEHEVSGGVIRAPEGELASLGFPGVWVTGQAGGATTYLRSLRSGAAVADRVLQSLRGEGSRGPTPLPSL